jgi:membrane-bound ClpP family serine protease
VSTQDPTYAQAPVGPLAYQRPRNGLGVAALVIGVASIVAAISFILFPLALLGGIIGLILGIIALARGRSGGTTNRGQAAVGLISSIIALLIAVPLSIRVGTWAAENPEAFTRLDKCIAKAGDRVKISGCIARFATDLQTNKS